MKRRFAEPRTIDLKAQSNPTALEILEIPPIKLAHISPF
jgi:hypothetical protein